MGGKATSFCATPVESGDGDSGRGGPSSLLTFFFIIYLSAAVDLRGVFAQHTDVPSPCQACDKTAECPYQHFPAQRLRPRLLHRPPHAPDFIPVLRLCESWQCASGFPKNLKAAEGLGGQRFIHPRNSRWVRQMLTRARAHSHTNTFLPFVNRRKSKFYSTVLFVLYCAVKL